MTATHMFIIAFGALVVWLIVQAKRAGPSQLDQIVLDRASVVRSADGSGEVWSDLGSKTTADGMNLRFDHDDDPEAEASFMIEDRGKASSLANRMTIRLTDAFETYHVHTRGYIFRVSVRGTGPVVGKDIRMAMRMHTDGKPYCGRIENDDDTDAAVGGWIEFDSVELLRVP